MTKVKSIPRPMRFHRTNPDIHALKYPYIVMPKLNGIRCVVSKAPETDHDVPVPLTNSLAVIPNLEIQRELSGMQFDGLDGELVVGHSNAPDVFTRTSKFVRAASPSLSTERWTYFVFDYWNKQDKPYAARLQELAFMVSQSRMHPNIYLVPYAIADSPLDVMKKYAFWVKERRYEGLILRNPNGMYKFGRTTLREQNGFKLKDRRDGEAKVLGISKAMLNLNEQTIDARGFAKRSKKKENLVPKNTMGALYVQDLETGHKFHIGTGFTPQERDWWFNAVDATSLIVKYTYFEIGSQGAPLQPVYAGIRDLFDLPYRHKQER